MKVHGGYKNEIELLKMKTTLSEVKIPVGENNSKLDTAEENIRVLQNLATVVKHKDKK